MKTQTYKTQTEAIKEKLTDNMGFLYAKGIATQFFADEQFALGCMQLDGNTIVAKDGEFVTVFGKQ